MLKVAIITSNELRHDYFRLSLCNSKDFSVEYSIIEDNENNKQYISNNKNNTQIKNYLDHRIITEKDFFLDFIKSVDSKKNKLINIKKNQINSNFVINYISNNKPDLLITFGCGIIKNDLIKIMKNKIINIHLGISPYYLGSATNYHALVNGDFHLVGYTFMYLNSGIDTGEIIHQSRADIYLGDNSHQIGNRLIKKMTYDMLLLLKNFKKIKPQKQRVFKNSKIYKKKDFTTKSLNRLFINLSNFNNAKKYINKKNISEKKDKIIFQKFMSK